MLVKGNEGTVRGLVRNAPKAPQYVLPCATQREARPSPRDSRQ